MTTIRPILATGRVRLSRVMYYSDLTSRHPVSLPLGVMCDITVGEVYGLSLMALRTLSDEELRGVGKLIKDELHSPFEFLKREFKWVWNQSERRAHAFADLACKHSASLRFEEPRENRARVPKALSVRYEVEDLKRWARDEVVAKTKSEYWALMSEEPLQEPPKIDLKRGALVEIVPPTKMAA